MLQGRCYVAITALLTIGNIASNWLPWHFLERLEVKGRIGDSHGNTQRVAYNRKARSSTWGGGTMDRMAPIGVYDSGLGGLTVVRQLKSKLPMEQILYFGDTARVPYGGRPPAEIQQISREILTFFQDSGAKAAIAACNTSSALALPVVSDEFSIPIYGLIEAAAKKAVGSTHNGRIGVLATEGTVKSGAYQIWLKRLLPDAEVVAQACPRLVPLVESNKIESPEAAIALQEYLAGSRRAEIDTLILGCTHYPFFAPQIQEILGKDVRLIDPAAEIVEVVAADLAWREMNAPTRRRRDRYYVSGDPKHFAELGATLLGEPLPPVEKVEVHAPVVRTEETVLPTPT